ncbi:MAG TPA: hypothetical protein VJS92_14575, partial [Candidatus Polarisedimenticolaceae bacterium]|nr:hypothetical protein [Candidatus Polarisedimenticolaceae bacterium]
MREGVRWAGAIFAAHVAAGALVLSAGYIRPDSVAVYAYLRSAVFDADLLFFDEWQAAGLVYKHVTLYSEVTPVGALANHWWIGTALVDAPAYLLADGLRRCAPSLGGADGFGGPYKWTLAWCSVACGAGALVLARQRLEGIRAPAVIAGLVAAALGTPFAWYV